jgi:hypothetical protein
VPDSDAAFKTKVVLMGCLAVAAVAVAFAFPRFGQDPSYHAFADQRPFAGVPNLLNVASNVVFAVAGSLGLRFVWKHDGASTEQGERVAAALLFSSTILVAAGSAYYHLCPTNQTLVWDRLPMTVAFMSLLALLIGDRIGPRAGRWLLGPLIAVGTGSVLRWWLTEAAGRGDLRLYALVQFFPMLAIPLMLLLFPGRYHGAAGFGWMLGWYALAKVFELLDRQIFAVGGVVSGHTLKHVAAGIAVLQLWRAMHRRANRAGGATQHPDTIPADRKETAPGGISSLRPLEAPWN